MKPIGGELPLRDKNNYFFTDSGRSSLRFFCKNFPDKKILLPNFLCDVIVDILEQESIEYSFYNILDDLAIDTLPKEEFDVFYVINYFGKQLSIPKEVENKIIIEDNVFYINFTNQNNYKFWFAFNSYRKIVNVADGSMIKTNLLLHDYRYSGQALFSNLKYEAKELKHSILTNKTEKDTAYLLKFEDAETQLDKQTDIFHISDTSMGQINKFLLSCAKEQEIREYNYKYVIKKLSEFSIRIQSNFYSYAILVLPYRNELRRYLFSKKVFLPIHWPESIGNNLLHHRILSIPLFYTIEETVYIVNLIEDYYKNKDDLEK